MHLAVGMFASFFSVAWCYCQDCSVVCSQPHYSLSSSTTIISTSQVAFFNLLAKYIPNPLVSVSRSWWLIYILPQVDGNSACKTSFPSTWFSNYKYDKLFLKHCIPGTWDYKWYLKKKTTTTKNQKQKNPQTTVYSQTWTAFSNFVSGLLLSCGFS